MFGPYEVLDLVAIGASGKVYRVRHLELSRTAAVKELSAELRNVAGFLERLRGEAEVLSGLSHPNIVDVYDYVEEPNRVWLAEEWVDGASLQAILDAHKQLTPEQSLGVMRGALMGLAYTHERGVVHRDISTGNILADQQGTSMLVDFGLAAPVGEGAAIGTPAFLSPEAARGESIGKPGDVYSAAAVLYTLLSGRSVFEARDAVSMVRAHIEQAAPRLEQHGADVANLMRRSLSKDPAERPADAAAFLAELEDAARRRFGADWLGRASIAGLVGAATVGVTAVAGGAGVATAGAQTIVFDAAHAGAALPAAVSTTTKPVRSLGSKLGIAAGAGLATAVVVIGAYALTNGGDSGTSPVAQPGTSPSPSPTPTPTTDPVVDTAPAGVWVVSSRVIKSDNPQFAKVGTKDSDVTWRLKLSCETAAECGGAIRSSSGRKFTYNWDGSAISVDTGKTNVVEGLCQDDAGKKIPGTHFKEVFRGADVTLVARGKRYVGDYTVHSKVSELQGGCVNTYTDTGSPDPTATWRWTMSPKT